MSSKTEMLFILDLTSKHIQIKNKSISSNISLGGIYFFICTNQRDGKIFNSHFCFIQRVIMVQLYQI